MREREELDRILPDLLRSMGFQLVKVAFRGEVENGVDIAALHRQNGADFLYLFQVKAGDITPDLWHAGSNSIRASLEDIADVDFAEGGNRRVSEAKRVVVVVHNGVLRENCRAKWNGFAKNYRHPLERWGIDRLTTLVERYLTNEYLLPVDQRQLLRKTLEFIDVPDYDFRHCKELYSRFFNSLRKGSAAATIRKRFSTLRLLMAMVHKYSKDAGNLTPSVHLGERALLSAWNWIAQTGDRRPTCTQELQRTYALWFGHCLEYLSRIEPAVLAPDGLCLVGMHEVIEYPARAFDTVQLLAVMLLSAVEYGRVEIVRPLTKLLVSCVSNNIAGCCRPQIDSHMNAIMTGMLALVSAGAGRLARHWLEELFGDLQLRVRAQRPLPELNNRLDLVVEYEATGEKPSPYSDESSLLIYSLFELCLLLDAAPIYDMCRETFKETDLQVWYPPLDYEILIYNEEIRSGDTETSIVLPETFAEFRSHVEARYRTRDLPLQAARKSPAILMLLAARHFGTPVPTFIWRSAIFAEKDNLHAPA
jgi:hypothetical protein